MLVFSEIMTFMWQYYVTKDTKYKDYESIPLMEYVVPGELFKSTNQNFSYVLSNKKYMLYNFNTISKQFHKVEYNLRGHIRFLRITYFFINQVYFYHR